MEQKEFDEMMERWMEQREQTQGEESAQMEWAVHIGLTDGKSPRAYVTREESVLMIAAALRYWTSCVINLLKGDADVYRQNIESAGP